MVLMRCVGRRREKDVRFEHFKCGGGKTPTIRSQDEVKGQLLAIRVLQGRDSKRLSIFRPHNDLVFRTPRDILCRKSGL